MGSLIFVVLTALILHSSVLPGFCNVSKSDESEGMPSADSLENVSSDEIMKKLGADSDDKIENIKAPPPPSNPSPRANQPTVAKPPAAAAKATSSSSSSSEEKKKPDIADIIGKERMKRNRTRKHKYNGMYGHKNKKKRKRGKHSKWHRKGHRALRKAERKRMWEEHGKHHKKQMKRETRKRHKNRQRFEPTKSFSHKSHTGKNHGGRKFGGGMKGFSSENGDRNKYDSDERYW